MGEVIELREGTKLDLSAASIRLGEVRGLKKTLTSEESEIKESFLKYFKKAAKKYFDDGAGYNVIDCEVKTVTLNHTELEKEIGTEIWDKITDKVVTTTVTMNPDKFRDALKSGDLSEEQVKKCTEVNTSHRLLRNEVKKEEKIETETVNDTVKSLIEGLSS